MPAFGDSTKRRFVAPADHVTDAPADLPSNIIPFRRPIHCLGANWTSRERG